MKSSFKKTLPSFMEESSDKLFPSSAREPLKNWKHLVNNISQTSILQCSEAAEEIARAKTSSCG